MKSPFHLGRLCTGYYRASMPVSALISVVMGQSDPKRAERLADGRSDRPLVAQSCRSESLESITIVNIGRWN